MNLFEVIIMNICFISPTIGTSGGRERVTVNIANAFASRGDSVTFIIISNQLDKPYYELDEKVELKLLSDGYEYSMARKVARKVCELTNWNLPPDIARGIFYSKKQVKSLTKLINDNYYDAVVAINGDLSLLLTQVKKEDLNNKKIKTIGWFHNTYNAYFKTKGKYCFGRLCLAKRELKKLDFVVSLTKKDADILAANLSCNAINIYNPLSFSTDEISTVSNNKLLFIGRMSMEQKGIDLLIDVLNMIKNQNKYPTWKAVLVGDGEDKKEIERRIKNSKLEDFVSLVGAHTNVIPYYLDADILLLTSRWEGFGLVVTEAFECGVPVVSFKNDGPDEIIADGVNGFIVDRFDVDKFAKKVMYLMDHESCRRRMSIDARKRADDFSIEMIIKKWREICK